MRLDSDQRALLAASRIGMLALGGRLPLVNPAAFHFGGGALWMTTSRHAAKLTLARRDPRAAFLVTPPRRPGHSVLLQGTLEAFDPRSPRSQLRAVMQGPGFAFNLAGYALKNAAFIGGYLLDLAAIPTDWWPQNRVLLRLRADRVSLVPPLQVAPALPARVLGAPAQVASAVARHRSAQLCWLAGGRPVLASVAWALDGADAVALLPDGVPRPPAGETAGALVIERHHPFRATRMRGLCLRGRLVAEPDARSLLAERYQDALPDGGRVLRLAVQRVTWWRGFQVGTHRVERTAPAVAEVP